MAKQLFLSIVGPLRTSWFISFSALTHISTTLLHLPAMSRTQRLSTFTRPAPSRGQGRQMAQFYTTGITQACQVACSEQCGWRISSFLLPVKLGPKSHGHISSLAVG